MIPIPESVTIKRNKASETNLLATSRAWLEKGNGTRTQGWHASDILNPRKGFWQRVDPKEMTDRDVTIFLVGKVLHAFVLGSAAGDVVDLDKTDEGSSYSEELGLWYSPDWDKGEVAEFKTSRSYKEPSSIEDVSGYTEQLLVYMAAKNRLKAQLWILLINLRDPETRRTVPVFRCYTIEISQADLDATKAFIKQTKDDLNKAVATSNWHDLDLCWEFICTPDMCPYFNKCKPDGRWHGEQ